MLSFSDSTQIIYSSFYILWGNSTSLDLKLFEQIKSIFLFPRIASYILVWYVTMFCCFASTQEKQIQQRIHGQQELAITPTNGINLEAKRCVEMWLKMPGMHLKRKIEYLFTAHYEVTTNLLIKHVQFTDFFFLN